MYLSIECVLVGDFKVNGIEMANFAFIAWKNLIMFDVFRVENAEEPSLEPILSYLCDIPLQKDKSGMWQCLKW